MTRAAVIAVMLAASPTVVSAQAMLGKAELIATYGAAPPDDGRALRAQRVFRRVRDAADKKDRLPELIVLADRQALTAEALPDGTSVVVTLATLDHCFADESEDVGDARLAFVLAHELAHLAHDDFWHAFAVRRLLDALKRLDEATQRQIKALQATPREAARTELHADETAVITMVMAGYDPAPIVTSGASFLNAWIKKVFGDAIAPDPRHPEVKRRLDAVQSALRAAIDRLDLFHFGVRLAQLGRLDDALRLLEEFGARFPSREVANNVGLLYYQKAAAALLSCGDRAPLRFLPPVRLDPDARLRRLRGHSSCPAADTYLDQALEALQSARRKDPHYLPARLNLAILKILLDDPAGSMSELADVAQPWLPPTGATVATTDEERDVLHVWAVATYAVGPVLASDTSTQALALLRQIREGRRDDPGLTYDIARILHELKRTAEARSEWERFLSLQPAGPHADEARARLALPASDPPPAAAPAPDEPAPRRPARPPLRARVPRATLDALKPPKGQGARIPGVTILSTPTATASALRFGGTIEIVEEKLSPPMCEADARIACGGVVSEHTAPGGGRTIVCDGLAFDLAEGHAVRRILFEPHPR